MSLRLGKKTGILLLAILFPFIGNAQGQESQAPIELTLDKAIEIAFSENPSIKIADVEIKKKKYARRSAQSALYPQIDAVGQYSRAIKKQVVYMDFDMSSSFLPIFSGLETTFQQTNPDTYSPGQLMDNINNIQLPEDPNARSDGGLEMGKDNTWAGGFQLNLPVIVPTLWKSLELSSVDVELAVEAARSSKINMVNSVSKAYYQVLFAQDAFNVLEKSYSNAVLNHENIKLKYEQGVVSEYDLIQADVNAKNIKPNLIQARNALNLATLSLKALMGIDMEQEIEVTGSLLDYEENLYAELLSLNPSLENNSDLIQFDLQNKQLQKSLELYRAQYLPTVAISGNYMFNSMYDDADDERPGSPSSSLNVSVSIPIFDGFKKRNEIKQAKVALQQMQWQREDVVRNLNLAVTNSINNMTNYVEQVMSTKDVVAQAQKGYEISQKLYDTGMGTLLDLNSAQLGLTQASLAYNQAIFNFLTSKADLEKTLGVELYTQKENNK